MASVFEDLSQAQSPSGAPATGIPFWGDSPESWDTVTIAGWRLPGLCKVTGKVKRRVDSKKMAGVNGRRVTYVSDDVATFSVTVKLWTAEHLETYSKLLTFLRSLVLNANVEKVKNEEGTIDQRKAALPDASKFPLVPVDIRHPALDLLRIKAVHIMEYGLPEPEGDAAEGIYTASIECEEYVPDSTGKRGKVKTPKGAVDWGKLGEGALPAAARKLQQPKPSESNARRP